MCVIYGYCRVSTTKQSIERQERNIKSVYPDAVIVKEAYTGTKMDRPEWNKLYKRIQPESTIVFDSVSRMSRNAEEGIETYFSLLEKGISLVFIKEPYINTEVYRSNAQERIELTGTDEDAIFSGINEYFKRLAVRQIRIAFEQSQKEVDDLHQRTREGIETARLNGKQIGQTKGATLVTKKSLASKDVILKHSKDFNGSLTDAECMKMLGISRNTFYKYKRELKEKTMTPQNQLIKISS